MLDRIVIHSLFVNVTAKYGCDNGCPSSDPLRRTYKHVLTNYHSSSWLESHGMSPAETISPHPSSNSSQQTIGFAHPQNHPGINANLLLPRVDREHAETNAERAFRDNFGRVTKVNNVDEPSDDKDLMATAFGRPAFVPRFT